MAVIDKHSFWVYGFFEETKLPHIRVGNKADLQMMSGEVLKCHVESISRGIYDRDNPESRELVADGEPAVHLVLGVLCCFWPLRPQPPSFSRAIHQKRCGTGRGRPGWATAGHCSECPAHAQSPAHAALGAAGSLPEIRLMAFANVITALR